MHITKPARAILIYHTFRGTIKDLFKVTEEVAWRGKNEAVFHQPVKLSNISKESEMTFNLKFTGLHHFVEWMALAPAIILQMAHMQQLVTPFNTLW